MKTTKAPTIKQSKLPVADLVSQMFDDTRMQEREDNDFIRYIKYTGPNTSDQDREDARLFLKCMCDFRACHKREWCNHDSEKFAKYADFPMQYWNWFFERYIAFLLERKRIKRIPSIYDNDLFARGTGLFVWLY